MDRKSLVPVDKIIPWLFLPQYWGAGGACQTGLNRFLISLKILVTAADYK
jgi:hypothetical protein